MSEIINFLLLEQPDRAEAAILDFLEGKRTGKPKRPQSSRQARDSSRGAALRDRQYMARKVQPVLEKLMRRVVEEQPRDVVSHFIDQLESAPQDFSPVRRQQPASSAAFVAPAALSDLACGALFRMLDEDGAGAMAGSVIVERVAKLHAIGVPIDATAKALWGSIVVDRDDSVILDHFAFAQVMAAACAAAASWMPAGSDRPKLSALAAGIVSISPAAVTAAAPSPAAAQPTQTLPPAKQQGRGEQQPATPTSGLVVGAAVKCNYRKSGNFYPGKIAVDHGDGTFDITYDDGDSEKRALASNIVAPDGSSLAAPAPATVVISGSGDGGSVALVVGTKVQCKYRGGKGNWYGGVVAAVHEGGMSFDVAYDDGETEVGARREHVKLLDPETGEAVACPGNGHEGEAAAGGSEGGAASLKVHLDPNFKPVVALIGRAGAGKSVLLRAMGGDPDPKPRPTMGFSQRKLGFELPGLGEVPVHWYDLPGSWTAKWEGYLVECHGMVHVIDAAADDAAFAQAVATCRETLGGARASGDGKSGPCARVAVGKPLLVLANKQDEAGARSSEAVAEALFGGDGAYHLGGGDGNWKVVGCSAHPVRAGGDFDPRAEAGLEWLVATVEQRFAELKARVKADEAAAEAERAAEKIERHRRVMTKVLKEKAFPADGKTLETFSEVDGFEFLAMELLLHDPQDSAKTRTADEQWGLTSVGQRCARLVGFQKVAMIMCADMINPESKASKTTHSWDEVIAYVMDCREEAGLPRDVE